MSNRTPSQQPRAVSQPGRGQGAKDALRGPPPQPGNKHNLKHAIHAVPEDERIDAVQAQLATMLPAVDAADALALRALAVTVIRWQEAVAYVSKRGAFDRRGKPTSAARWERRLSATMTRQLAPFGGTPSSRAKLGLKHLKAVDLAQALSEPNEQRRAVLLSEAGLAPGHGGETLCE